MRRPSPSLLNNLAFAAALAILAFLGWQGRQTQATLLAHGESARHSLELITEIQGILSSLQDVETGMRGYVITGDADYLAPYHAAASRLPAQRDRLAQLLAARGGVDDRWLPALDRDMRTRLASARENIEARRLRGLDGAIETLRQARGKVAMDRLRARLSGLEAAERRRLAADRQAVERQYERGRAQLLIGGTIVLLLLVGAFLAMNGHLRARRRLALDAQARRAFLRCVVDADENAIFVRDLDGCFILCNRAFAALLGLAPEDIEGREAASIPGIGAVAPLLAEGAAPAPGQGAVTTEHGIVDHAGRTWWLQLARRHIELPDGTVADLAVAVDISARREVARLKSEFVSTVSHELRTPLTAIRGALGMLVGGMAGTVPADMRPLLDIAHKNCERLVLLINDILDIEKLDAGRVRLHPVVLPLREAVAQSLEQNAPYAAQFDVALQLSGDVRANILADPDRFAQVMANLLSNAIKHSPRGGTVTVDLAAGDGYGSIGVTDRGSGIPPSFQPRIFERFAQADASDARRLGGTGLGLAITRTLVEQHGGTIAFDSRPGRTRFEVRLPLAPAGRPATPVATDAAGGEAAARPARVLHVEDDEDLRTLVARLLRDDPVTLVPAGSLAEARDVLAGAVPDLVVLDLMLPDGDGTELLDDLAALRPAPRVIVFSARDAALPDNPLVLPPMVKARQGAPELAAAVRTQLARQDGRRRNDEA